MILFINACVRKDSRTKLLADYLLEKLPREVEEVKLSEVDFPVADEAFLTLRDELVSSGETAHPLLAFARQFAAADTIVIAAPYWDLSFPASLKQYLEQINVTGITFRYTEEGIPVGLCRAQHLYYVATAGGPYVPEEYGYGYVKAMANAYYGITDTSYICAPGLDVYGADEARILREAREQIDALFPASNPVKAD